MKISVYKEQYERKQAHHHPCRIGYGYDIENFNNLGNTYV